MSTRLTLNVQLAELPEASVTVSVTVVVPTPDTAVPTAGDWVITREAAAVQLSFTVARLL